MTRLSRWLCPAALTTLATLGAVTHSSPAFADASAPAAEQFISDINALRASVGVGPLTESSTLDGIAASWSLKLEGAGVLSHNPSLRYLVPSNWLKLGENVGVGPSVPSLQQAFTNSPEHYANMVDGSFNQIGVAVETDSTGTLWVTEDYMKAPTAAAAVASPPAPAAAPPAPVRQPAPSVRSAPSPAPAAAPAAAAPAAPAPVAPRPPAPLVPLPVPAAQGAPVGGAPHPGSMSAVPAPQSPRRSVTAFPTVPTSTPPVALPALAPREHGTGPHRLSLGLSLAVIGILSTLLAGVVLLWRGRAGRPPVAARWDGAAVRDVVPDRGGRLPTKVRGRPEPAGYGRRQPTSPTAPGRRWVAGPSSPP